MKYNLWYVAPDDDTGKLVSAYSKHVQTDDANLILPAQPFTVSLNTILIAADHRQMLIERLFPQNGILILSSNSLGSKPEVQRVHYYQDHLPPAGTTLDNFLSDTIYLCDDFSGEERLWLEFHILGVGLPSEERDALVSKFTGLAETAGAIFPVTLPYSFIASSIAQTVDKLVNSLQKNKQLFNQRISFYPHHPHDAKNAGTSLDHTPLLRQGTYILFSEAVDAETYTLQDDDCLSPVPSISYIAFSIDGENAPSPDWVVSQRVALLLTHIKEGNPNAEQAPIEFLKDTLGGYSNFKNLKRYQELLEKKKQNPDGFSTAEQTLMNQLAAMPDIKAFLPS